jgi:hypothetical protein
MTSTLPAFYRSADPIDHLVVRVAVRKRTATVVPPATSQHVSNAAPAPVAPAAAGYDDERLEHVGEFAWQQKAGGLISYWGWLSTEDLWCMDAHDSESS